MSEKLTGFPTDTVSILALVSGAAVILFAMVSLGLTLFSVAEAIL